MAHPEQWLVVHARNGQCDVLLERARFLLATLSNMSSVLVGPVEVISWLPVNFTSSTMHCLRDRDTIARGNCNAARLPSRPALPRHDPAPGVMPVLVRFVVPSCLIVLSRGRSTLHGFYHAARSRSGR